MTLKPKWREHARRSVETRARKIDYPGGYIFYFCPCGCGETFLVVRFTLLSAVSPDRGFAYGAGLRLAAKRRPDIPTQF